MVVKTLMKLWEFFVYILEILSSFIVDRSNIREKEKIK